MARRLAFASFLILGLPALAGEPTPEEEGWIRSCVPRLGSASPRVAAGAAQALREFGPEAVRPMLLASAQLASEAGWRAFEKVLVAFGPAAAAERLVRERADWPAAAAKRLDGILERLKAAGPPAGDPEVAAEVRRELEPFRNAMSYSPSDPRIRRIAKLGRPAIPALVAAIRETAVGPWVGFHDQAAADALALIVDERDLPLLASLLEDGHLVAAVCFQRLHGDEALAALLAPLRNGFADHHLLDALERYSGDARVHRALIAYVESRGPLGGFDVGAAATFLGEAGVFDAVPALTKLLSSPDADVLRPAAGALVSLGVKEAIPVLIGIVERAARGEMSDEYQAHEAAESLNRVVGRKVYTGHIEPGDVRGNTKEAAKAFRAFWEKHGERLVFDRRSRRWKRD